MMEFSDKMVHKLMLLILYTVILVGCAFRFDKVLSVIAHLLSVLLPFIIGGMIAFFLNIPMRAIERRLPGKKDRHRTLRRVISLLLALILIAALITFVLILVVPEITKTIISLTSMIPQWLTEIQQYLETTFAENPEISEKLSDVNLSGSFDEAWKKILSFIQQGAGSFFATTIGTLIGLAGKLATFFIAFIFSIYLLLAKETLGRQSVRVMRAYLPDRAVQSILRVCTLISDTFTRYVTGQCVEACILGMMFFVGMSICRMPYAVLISVLCGVTALIPMFGYYIALVIGAFLMLVVSPAYAAGFIVLFLVIQQIEGNIIYPRVVGGSVGLPAIFVFAAVILGGSLFGLVGMLIFIPICSVIYQLLREDVQKKLARKNQTS